MAGLQLGLVENLTETTSKAVMASRLLSRANGLALSSTSPGVWTGKENVLNWLFLRHKETVKVGGAEGPGCRTGKIDSGQIKILFYRPELYLYSSKWWCCRQV